VLVVGDHGEGLGDHGELAHGFALYRSTLHVPSILFPKPAKPLLHAKPWRMEDLGATVREWFDLTPLNASDGESLFDRGKDQRLLPSSTVLPSIQFSVNPSLGMRKGNLMYMRQGSEELYDLATDPDENRDLARDPTHRSDLEKLRAACDAAFPVERLQAVAVPTVENTPVELQGLQGLGYVGGFVPPFGNLQPADLHRVMEDDARFERIRETYRKDRNHEGMIQAYRTILDKYPRAAPYWKNYGLLLLQLGRQGDALPVFERAAQLNPRDAGSLVNLGSLYLIKGEVPKAKVLFELALAVNDTNAVAHKNLGIIYATTLKDPAKAVMHYKRYLELGPDADAKIIRDYVQRVELGH
jgi:tetratricopeptide (TPR) repeat protein